MAKQKKKRTKVYSGADAATSRPTITRVQAANRNKVSQWWFDHERIAKPVAIAAIILLVIIIVIVEVVRLATGSA